MKQAPPTRSVVATLSVVLGLVWLTAGITTLLHYPTVAAFLSYAFRLSRLGIAHVLSVVLGGCECAFGWGLLRPRRRHRAGQFGLVLLGAMLIGATAAYSRAQHHSCSCLSFAGVHNFGMLNLAVIAISFVIVLVVVVTGSRSAE